MGHFDTDVSKLQSDLEEFYRVGGSRCILNSVGAAPLYFYLGA
jgi:hypothetical protein